MQRWVILCLLLAFLGARGFAQPMGQGKVSAALNLTAVQPGQQAAVAVVLDVGFGMHAQSHTPLQSFLIPLQVTLDNNPQIEASAPIYPPATIAQYPMLGKLSIYQGRVIVYVPLRIKESASPGDLQIAGTISYQICNERACFAPRKTAWQVRTRIVPAGQSIATGNAELFKNFNPAAFAETAAAPPAAAALTFNVLGWQIGTRSYFPAFIAALFIGIIFNIMPCVLPIVPLKAMGFYQVAQQNRARSILLGAVFSAGIVAAFGVLAVLVVGLRWLDWGKLFSYPAFSIAVVLVLLILALQTFGVFEVMLPQGVYRFTPSHETLVGNFLFGIFTAVLSTPCTFGMFLGLLIWASAQAGIVGVAVLMAAGVGMALPYLILSAFPALARRLPRAGAWAELVKQMMGFLLVATAIYFARAVLPADWRGVNIWWAIFAVVAASGLFLVVRTISITRRAGAIAIALVIALAIITPAWAVTRKLTYVPIDWHPYSPAALAAGRGADEPVLVDFTATWCFNCQALEADVLNSPPIVHAIRSGHVLSLRADLTDVKAPGWDLLRQLNPVGAIPMTVIYLPHQGPRQLAGLYSQKDLLDVLGNR